MNYVAALNGRAPRKLDQAFSYLELGCGQAYSTIVHAAAFPLGEFHACDFNCVYIAAGERHAAAFSIRNVRFHEASFGELLGRNLPEFDFIVLHGVYSWIGREVQRSIRHLIRERLKPGGLVYLGYNCQPGWTSEVPLRRLLIELAAASGSGSAQRTERAVHSLKRLSSSGLQYFSTNPSAVSAVDSYLRSPSGYLAHEFLNEAWEPLYSVDVADQMAEAELRYLGSATLVDNHDALVIDSLAAEAISELKTTRQRQLAIDFAVNRQFRRDVFVRTAEPAGTVGVARHLNDVVIGCLGDTEAIGAAALVPRGKIGFHPDFIHELRLLMSRGSTTLGQVAAALGGAARHEGEIVRNLTYLIASGAVTPFAKPFDSTGFLEPRGFRSATVAQMFSRVAAGDVPEQIASEVVGSAVEVDCIHAAAVIDYLSGKSRAGAKRVAEELVPRLMRLGLLI